MRQITAAVNLLFASEEELRRARVTPPQRERIMRLRAMYSYWVENPRITALQMGREIRRRYGVGDRAAREDVHALQHCLGELSRQTSDYYRWVFLQRCEELFEAARRENDTKAFAAALNAFGRYTRLDKDEDARPDYTEIAPQTFEITDNPEAAGFKRIPNVQQVAERLLARYSREAERQDAQAAPDFVGLTDE